METKTCKECLEEKPLDDFYAQAKNIDGKSGRCKECVKTAMRKRYYEKYEQVRKYDATRQRTPGRRAKKIEYTKTYRARNKYKQSAHAAVAKAILRGKLKKMPCDICGETQYVNAHHDDYSRPLDVVWLCPKHHAWIHG